MPLRCYAVMLSHSDKHALSAMLALPHSVLAVHLQVTGTCSVRGKYAQVGANNWPAQLIICGDPPGASSCAGAVYNSSLPVIEPGALLL